MYELIRIYEFFDFSHSFCFNQKGLRMYESIQIYEYVFPHSFCFNEKGLQMYE